MSTSWLVTLGFVAVLLGTNTSLAEEAHRRGYIRADGSDVGLERAPKRTLSETLHRPPASSRAMRDDDHDGIPNRRDTDDDNNGVLDDLE